MATEPRRPTIRAISCGSLEHAGRQLAPHRIELLASHVVFEAGDRRLRGERLTGDRISPEQQLVKGVVAQPVGIVPIGMATRDAEDPLAEQVRQRMPDLARLPLRQSVTRWRSCEWWTGGDTAKSRGCGFAPRIGSVRRRPGGVSGSESRPRGC